MSDTTAMCVNENILTAAYIKAAATTCRQCTEPRWLKSKGFCSALNGNTTRRQLISMKGILLMSWVTLMMAPLSHACVCLPPKHPQEHFCESEFVIRAYVEKRTEDQSTHTALYSVQVLDVLKQPDNVTLFARHESNKTSKLTANDTTEATTTDNRTETHTAVLYTSLWSSLCGAHLKLRTTYILGGRIMAEKMFIGLCGLHVEDDVKSLNKRQKAGFFRKYKDNCDCKIQYCAGKRCPPDNDDQCSVKSFLSFDDFMDCANRYSMCRRRNGKCQWTKNRKHTLCQNQALKRRYFRH